jgi:hypothetical protein
MSLTVTCPCGTRFEVEETYAGRGVGCPDCQRAVVVPAPRRAAPRTSGFAIASLVLALLGAFTVVGTAVAVLFGAVALVRIARDRENVTGAGFALFGIVLGCAFTALTVFAYSRGELFGFGDQIRAQNMAGKVDHGGPLEVVRQPPGFKIVRPNERWGVARPELMAELENDSDLLLVNTARDAYVDVEKQELNGRNLEAHRQGVIDWYRNEEKAPPKGELPRVRELKVLANRQLPTRGGLELGEVVLEMRDTGQRLTFVIRLARPVRSNVVYQLRAWTGRRRFPQMEEELRKVLDSFEVIGGR